MTTIGFICCLMAHAIVTGEVARRGLKVRVLSAGVSTGFEGMLAAREARLACDRHKTAMPKFIGTHISNTDVSICQRLFVMERAQIAAVSTYTTLPTERITLLGEYNPQRRGLEIEDPMGHDRAAFDRCYAQLRDCIVHYPDTTDDLVLRRNSCFRTAGNDGTKKSPLPKSSVPLWKVREQAGR
jgi:protein-tyrosine-phosphatase